ncbi:hypothetical protein [Propylenella binzhouense]|uniref:Uncharacterized protein n=1 Tax=Propylenella binzhouense TaxID=2555902 RepID=A0A964T860_9HYPH|nr:hypothetical protein [Propylenella binzhouense]MYZ50250.1 hypothetical protein [Propylenella binzhouense]
MQQADIAPAGARPEGGGGAAAERRKQAVVVIHGMGEQRPMDTLRGFVDAVWLRGRPAEEQARHRRAWIVPDKRAGSYELRRITTGYDDSTAKDLRTDFFEFYWADLMEGTTLQHLWSWVRGLLIRPIWAVPWRRMAAWIVLWLLVIGMALALLGAADPKNALVVWAGHRLGRPALWAAAHAREVLLALAGAAAALTVLRLAYLLTRRRHAEGDALLSEPAGVNVAGPLMSAVAAGSIFLSIPADASYDPEPFARLLLAGLAVAGAAIVHLFVVPYLGDVARYVRAAADTVEKRQAIRERGLALLRELHAQQQYRRIVVVGHSLGSIVAYDLLLQLWAERGPARDRLPSADAADALAQVDRFVGCRSDRFDLEAYRRAQWAVFDALRRRSDDWLISDFVTLGSPLGLADFLLARDARHLEAMKTERLVATAPPVATERGEAAAPGERGGGGRPDRPTMFYTDTVAGQQVQIPHHAALFAAVRWTNICDPPRGVFFGDLISGPVAPWFGPGVKDIRVKMRRRLLGWLSWRFFTHTLYWSTDRPLGAGQAHLRALRTALALDDETGRGGGGAGACLRPPLGAVERAD